MSSHNITERYVTPAGAHKARCACGAAPVNARSSQDVEDWWVQHMQIVERARAALAPKTPSLKSQRDYYASKADDTTLPDGERALWRQLADELTARLGAQAGNTQDLLW